MSARAAGTFLTLSILLSSVAQILFRLAMQHLSLTGDDPVSVVAGLVSNDAVTELAPLAIGVVCYVVSMLCWIFALVRFKVSVAYPFISISYVIVYAAAVLLPVLNESITWRSLLGIGFIVAGVCLLARQGRQNSGKAIS